MTPILLALGRIGIQELLIVLAIVLVIFGPKQLPKLAKTFGKTINNFKKGVNEGLEDDDEKKEEPSEEAKAEEEKTEDKAEEEKTEDEE